MFDVYKAKFEVFRNSKMSTGAFAFNNVVLGALFALLLASVPVDAMAQTLDIPFINEFGCKVVRWLQGPLAILIFIIVVVATLVVGMIAKMDWGRIIQIVVVFGLITGLGSMFAGSSFAQSSSLVSSCLRAM